DFAFEQAHSTAAAATPEVRVVANHVAISLGNGLLQVSDGQGFFLITSGGLAGTVDATIALNVPGVTLGGHFQLLLNTSAAAVHETFTLGSAPITLDAPAGPYVRVSGIGVNVSALGVTLSGDYDIERSGPTGAAQLSVKARNVNAGFGA